ncbi:hypothetical protein D3C78_1145820 [compost metagenome]
MARGRQRGHVERAAYLKATTLHASTPPGIARVVGQRCDAHERSDLPTIEFAQLRQLGEQRGAGYRPDALGRAQQRVELAEVLLHMPDHLAFDIVELGLDGLDHGFDARAHPGHRQWHALALRQQHGQQLPSTRDQCGQLTLRRVGERPDIVGHIRLTGQRVGEGRQGARVDGIGLGQVAHALGKVTRLPGVDHGHGKARRL